MMLRDRTIWFLGIACGALVGVGFGAAAWCGDSPAVLAGSLKQPALDSRPIEARPLTDRILSYTVYDGDTLTRCEIDLGYGITLRDSVRIVGVDTPEVTGTHREAGLVVRAAAKAWLGGHRELWLIGHGRGKYGRILGDVRSPGVGQSLGEWLLEKGYAKPTGKGGKRYPWSAEELERITSGT